MKVLTCENRRELYDKSIEDLGYKVEVAPTLRLFDGTFTGLSEFRCTGKVWTDAETGEELVEFKTFKGHAILLRGSGK